MTTTCTCNINRNSDGLLFLLHRNVAWCALCSAKGLHSFFKLLVIARDFDVGSRIGMLCCHRPYLGIKDILEVKELAREGTFDLGR